MKTTQVWQVCGEYVLLVICCNVPPVKIFVDINGFVLVRFAAHAMSMLEPQIYLPQHWTLVEIKSCRR